MRKPLPPTNKFQIAFEVKGHGGYIKTVQITIENDVMDAMDHARVDLADHPLYKHLQAYVLSNPR